MQAPLSTRVENVAETIKHLQKLQENQMVQKNVTNCMWYSELNYYVIPAFSRVKWLIFHNCMSSQDWLKKRQQYTFNSMQVSTVLTKKKKKFSSYWL